MAVFRPAAVRATAPPDLSSALAKMARRTIAPSVIADNASGVSSDGRGPYIQGADGVRNSIVVYVAGLSFDKSSKSVKNPRKYTVNLNNPVPGGGGVPLGTITDGDDNNIEIQWYRVGNARQNLHNIPVGQTVTADQIDLTFHVTGRFHILQMGPQAYGHCHSAPTGVIRHRNVHGNHLPAERDEMGGRSARGKRGPSLRSLQHRPVRGRQGPLLHSAAFRDRELTILRHGGSA